MTVTGLEELNTKRLLDRFFSSSITDAVSDAKKELARRSLIEFVKYTHPFYVVDPAHELIASKLDSIVSGELQRLMIFAPPQHGKSELTSIRLPAFWIGTRPGDPIIMSSYAASLSHSMSRNARNLVDSLEYRELFPDIKLSSGSRSVHHWEIANYHRGGVVSAGVGGPITGHGAALGIIDDPFENWEQAQSETIREKVWNWWKGTFRTRIWEGGSIVIILTRWHEDDLAGRLLLENWVAKGGEVLRLPAIAENQSDRDVNNEKMRLPIGLDDPLGRNDGEPLCPSLFSIEALHDIKTDVGELVWEAEYQGNPVLPGGNRFKRSWFPIIGSMPTREVRRGRYWDLAATQDGGAKTAGLLLAIDKDDNIYIEDVVLGQWDTDIRNRIMRDTAQADHNKYRNHGRMWFEEEGGSSGKDASRHIIRHMMGFAVQADRPTGDKDVRLNPFHSQAGEGRVKLISGKWNGPYIAEMCSIPAGKYRDQADATAGAFNKLAGSKVKIARIY